MVSIPERVRLAGARLARHDRQEAETEGYVADLGELVRRTCLAPETVATVLAELGQWDVAAVPAMLADDLRQLEARGLVDVIELDGELRCRPSVAAETSHGS